MMRIRTRVTILLLYLLAGLSLWAQVDPDVCRQVREDDVATLVSLNQSTVEVTDTPNSGECTWTVKTPLTTQGYGVKLTVKRFDSHQEAVAEMKGGLPFYFDQKLPLVKTTGPDDHVLDLLNPNPVAATAQAVHDAYMSNVEVYPIEPSARAHPTFEYRLQRLALQAVGATILPSVGLPADPVRPKAQPPDAREHADMPASAKFLVGSFDVALIAFAVGLGLFLSRFFRRRG